MGAEAALLPRSHTIDASTTTDTLACSLQSTLRDVYERAGQTTCDNCGQNDSITAILGLAVHPSEAAVSGLAPALSFGRVIVTVESSYVTAARVT